MHAKDEDVMKNDAKVQLTDLGTLSAAFNVDGGYLHHPPQISIRVRSHLSYVPGTVESSGLSAHLCHHGEGYLINITLRVVVVGIDFISSVYVEADVFHVCLSISRQLASQLIHIEIYVAVRTVFVTIKYNLPSIDIPHINVQVCCAHPGQRCSVLGSDIQSLQLFFYIVFYMIFRATMAHVGIPFLIIQILLRVSTAPIIGYGIVRIGVEHIDVSKPSTHFDAVVTCTTISTSPFLAVSLWPSVCANALGPILHAGIVVTPISADFDTPKNQTKLVRGDPKLSHKIYVYLSILVDSLIFQ